MNCQARFLCTVLVADGISVIRKSTDHDTCVEEYVGKRTARADGTATGVDSQLGKCKALEEIVFARDQLRQPGFLGCGCRCDFERLEDADDRRRKLEYG